VHVEEFRHRRVGLRIVTLAEARVRDASLLVEEVLGRPVLILIRIPGGHLAVDCDRPGDPEALHGGRDIGWDLLEIELRGMNPHDHEAAALVGVVKDLEMRDGTHAVDAREGPEVDEHDLAAEVGKGQRRGVEPPVDTREVRRNDALADREHLPAGARRCGWGRRIVHHGEEHRGHDERGDGCEGGAVSGHLVSTRLYGLLVEEPLRPRSVSASL
jgi:hypothetical protein